jgi:hypothetical protein
MRATKTGPVHDQPGVLIGLHVVGSSLFGGDPNETKEPNMATIEELIEALLHLLPDAEVTLDNDGQVVIYTGLKTPRKPSQQTVVDL